MNLQKMSNVPYRYVFGTAYTNVVDSRITSPVVSWKTALVLDDPNVDHEEFRKQFYHDNAIKLSESNIATTEFLGKPIYVNHDKNLRVGTIIAAWCAKNNPNHLLLFGKVTNQETIKKVDDGTLRSFSMGYSAGMKTFKGEENSKFNSYVVAAKQIEEVSLCEEPFFDGCTVELTMSKKRPSFLSATRYNIPFKKTKQISLLILFFLNKFYRKTEVSGVKRVKITNMSEGETGKTQSAPPSQAQSKFSQQKQQQAKPATNQSTQKPPATQKPPTTQKPQAKQLPQTSKQQQPQEPQEPQDEMDQEPASADADGDIDMDSETKDTAARQMAQELEKAMKLLRKVQNENKDLKGYVSSQNKETAEWLSMKIAEALELKPDEGEDSVVIPEDMSAFISFVSSDPKEGKDYLTLFDHFKKMETDHTNDKEALKEATKNLKTKEAEVEKLKKAVQRASSGLGIGDLFDTQQSTSLKTTKDKKTAPAPPQVKLSSKLKVPVEEKKPSYRKESLAASKGKQTGFKVQPPKLRSEIEKEEAENEEEKVDEEEEEGQRNEQDDESSEDHHTKVKASRKRHQMWDETEARKRFKTTEQKMVKEGLYPSSSKAMKEAVSAIRSGLRSTGFNVPIFNQKSFQRKGMVLEDRDSDEVTKAGGRIFDGKRDDTPLRKWANTATRDDD